ncbi:MAG: DNA-binding protein AraC-type [Candidatus Angelobacter sp.]|nr:DNA-binding protein AraC-type [Candidatus Angelobacter sp.]
MSKSLNMGQFFGDVAERWAGDSVVVNRLVHHHARKLPSHAHQAGFVSLMLEGNYRETAGLTQIGYHPFSCVYHPPGMDHHDEVGAAGVTLLTLEFKPELFDAIDFSTVNLRSIIDLSGARPAWELMDFFRRLTARHTNQLDLESRAVALAYSIVRRSVRVPRDLRSLRRACEYVQAHFGLNLTLAQVARAAGVHPVYLGEAFRHEFGETLGEYLNRIRVLGAADRLASSDLPLSTIALDFGFYDQSHFTRIFRQFTGATPGAFRADYTSHKIPVAALS